MIRDRVTARVLLIDTRNRLLLVRYRNYADPDGPDFWATIGGAAEPGESIEAAAAREIVEETGIADARLGPIVWYGEWILPSFEGETRRFMESFIVAHCETTALDASGWTELERQMMLEARWWTAEEIAASRALIYPLDLRTLLPPILAGAYPKEIVRLRTS